MLRPALTLNPDSAANPSAPSKGQYTAHRERQRSRILAAARNLFDRQGIDRVLMAEIISVTGIRASTLYEYFANKDEIVWALVEEILLHSAAAFHKKLEAVKDSSGLSRITALLEAFGEELVDRPDHVRFMAQFDAMYARDWTAERLISLEDRIHPGRFEPAAALIREGMADGSLRADLDPDLTLPAIMNAVIGSQRRLASLGNRVEQEYGQPIQELFHETIRIILFGLRAP